MKKSFLFYTISGVLLCSSSSLSYALDAPSVRVQFMKDHENSQDFTHDKIVSLNKDSHDRSSAFVSKNRRQRYVRAPEYPENSSSDPNYNYGSSGDYTYGYPNSIYTHDPDSSPTLPPPPPPLPQMSRNLNGNSSSLLDPSSSPNPSNKNASLPSTGSNPSQPSIPQAPTPQPSQQGASRSDETPVLSPKSHTQTTQNTLITTEQSSKPTNPTNTPGKGAGTAEGSGPRGNLTSTTSSPQNNSESTQPKAPKKQESQKSTVETSPPHGTTSSGSQATNNPKNPLTNGASSPTAEEPATGKTKNEIEKKSSEQPKASSLPTAPIETVSGSKESQQSTQIEEQPLRTETLQTVQTHTETQWTNNTESTAENQETPTQNGSAESTQNGKKAKSRRRPETGFSSSSSPVQETPSHSSVSQQTPEISGNPVTSTDADPKKTLQNAAGKSTQASINPQSTGRSAEESSSSNSPAQGKPSRPASKPEPKESENPAKSTDENQKTSPQNAAGKSTQASINPQSTGRSAEESSSSNSPAQGKPSRPASQPAPKESENPAKSTDENQKTPPQNAAGKSTQASINPQSTGPSTAESSSPNSPVQGAPSPSSTSTQSAAVQLETAVKLVPKGQSELTKPILSEPKASENPVQIAELSTNISIENGTTLTQQNAKIHDKYFAAHVEGENSVLILNGGTVTSDFVGLSASEGGRIDATAITQTAVSLGLVTTNGTITLKDSTVNVTGNYGTYGIFFYDLPQPSERRYARSAERSMHTLQKQKIPNKVTLKNTKLFVEQGIGVGAIIANGEVILKNSEIHAALLSSNGRNQSNSTNTLMLTADNSLLKGGARTLGKSKTVFTLTNDTKWLLTTNKNFVNNERDLLEDGKFNVDKRVYSNLSKLTLTESSILFAQPTQGDYQTLFVGFNPQKDETFHATPVYNAEGEARIYLNAQWSPSSPIAEQKTDRLVIDGDVSGTTMVHINLLGKEKEPVDRNSAWGKHMASLPLATHGISVVQVSGNANESSFKLAGDYMTMGHLPYKYVLKAYGPDKSHETQNLFGKNARNFWDFRLQNDYLDADKNIRTLLPQVANYLVLPNTLFSIGLADVNNQNTLLDNMRIEMFGPEEKNKNGIFFSSYGEKITLSSNRSPLQYGYGADINYGALQIGTVLATLEGKEVNTYWGLLGTYGKVAFTPKNMKDSEKTTFNKWSLTAYSGIQHSNGLYINALLSYGTLKGNITTKLIGNTATLDGTETLTASTTIGQKFITDAKDLTFESQMQVVYQNLIFDIISDANNLEVDMDNPHQWLVRVGGRLTKKLMTSEENNAFSFYGKVNFLKAFGDGGAIKIADTFRLDPIGSALEGGFGMNASLSQKIVLHGDISYRHKLQKAGVSGTHFSGGIRYHF